MMSSTFIDVEERTDKGKNESRRLRRSGRVPAILYGAKKPEVAIALSPKDLHQVLHSEAGENSLLHLRLKGKDAKRHAMIKEIQTDPVTGQVVHADFIRIEMDAKVQVSVPVKLEGTAVGVKEQGGGDGNRSPPASGGVPA
ncbi:MAG: 50S ribosomal protein L25, partial [Acidobacteriota bacterium]